MGAGIEYREDEFSFDMARDNVRGCTSILIDDLNLEIDEFGKIVSVWGVCPYTRWVDAPLTPPDAACGDIFVQTDAPIERGVSQRLKLDKYLPTFVDRAKGWVVIRGLPDAKFAIKMFSGVILEIGRDGQFCALWLHPLHGIIDGARGPI